MDDMEMARLNFFIRLKEDMGKLKITPQEVVKVIGGALQPPEQEIYQPPIILEPEVIEQGGNTLSVQDRKYDVRKWLKKNITQTKHGKNIPMESVEPIMNIILEDNCRSSTTLLTQHIKEKTGITVSRWLLYPIKRMLSKYNLPNESEGLPPVKEKNVDRRTLKKVDKRTLEEKLFDYINKTSLAKDFDSETKDFIVKLLLSEGLEGRPREQKKAIYDKCNVTGTIQLIQIMHRMMKIYYDAHPPEPFELTSLDEADPKIKKQIRSEVMRLFANDWNEEDIKKHLEHKYRKVILPTYMKYIKSSYRKIIAEKRSMEGKVDEVYNKFKKMPISEQKKIVEKEIIRYIKFGWNNKRIREAVKIRFGTDDYNIFINDLITKHKTLYVKNPDKVKKDEKDERVRASYTGLLK